MSTSWRSPPWHCLIDRGKSNETILSCFGLSDFAGDCCRIGDWLAARGIRYLYDERYRIVADAALRPDFYLPEFDIYIEYWGMETKDYLERKREKQFLYQRAAKRLISLGPADLPCIEEILEEKLSRYITLPKDSIRFADLRPSANTPPATAPQAESPARPAFLPDGAEIRPNPAPRPSHWLGW